MEIYGETSRTGYDRGREHLSAMDKGDPNHPLVQHFQEEHKETQQVSAKMSILKIEEKNVYRQAQEGVYITSFKGDCILNGRGDWGQNLPPKLEVDRKRQAPSCERKDDAKKRRREDPDPPGGPPGGGGSQGAENTPPMGRQNAPPRETKWGSPPPYEK